jgi:hypothetical protein
MGVIFDPVESVRCRDCGGAVDYDTLALKPGRDGNASIETFDDGSLGFAVTAPGACPQCGSGRVLVAMGVGVARR